jgi:hypothetical protein
VRAARAAFAALLALELDKTRQLAAAGIDRQPGNRRQISARDQHHLGAMRGERTARNGAGDHPRQIEHADACKRPVAGRPRFRRGLADFFDCDHRQCGQRAGMRQVRPFVM